MAQPLTSGVLLTGGSGFIGTALAAHLTSAGTEVTTLDLRPPLDRSMRERWVRGDVRDLDDPALRRALGPALEHCPTIIHLAGLAGDGSPSERALTSTNVGGTRAVVDLATTTGARRLVLVSSIAALGPSERPLDESAPLRPVTAYGRSKAGAEAQVGRANGCLEVTVVRPGYVFGRSHPGNFGRMEEALRTGRFVLPGRDDTLKSGIYLPDLVRLLAFLASVSDPPPVVHAVYPDTPTVLAWARMVADTQPGVRRPPSVLPEVVARAAIRALDLAVMATGAERPAEMATAARKLRESSNVVSRVLPLEGCAFAHTWRTALADMTGTQ